jgi:glycosyltransferase involved in cell wall biosynthesis
MNIMEIVSGQGAGGAVCHCLMLTRELVRRGHRVTLVCRPNAWISGQLDAEPVEVVESELRRWPADELRRIAGVTVERGIDVVHTHLSRAHSFGVLLRWFSRVPCVATAQSRHLRLHWMLNDRVIAVSDTTRRYHRTYNLVRAERMVTIHNFIDYDRFSRAPEKTRGAMRASLGVDDASPLVGMVGSVRPGKGQIRLVGAMPKILAAEPKARLVLVGDACDAEHAAEVQATAAHLGVASEIVWTGRRDDPDAVMAALDLLALPSSEASIPLSLLEAMAAGLPVVATEVGGIPECVVSGETGTLVPLADADALAEAILALVRDPAKRRRYGEAGRRRVRERFSMERQAASIESVFAEVAGQSRAA